MSEYVVTGWLAAFLFFLLLLGAGTFVAFVVEFVRAIYRAARAREGAQR